jgi:hypothetical protein
MFLVVFAPLYSVAVLLTGAWRQPPILLLVAYSWGFLILVVVLTEQAVPRFEMGLAWLVPLALAALIAKVHPYRFVSEGSLL